MRATVDPDRCQGHTRCNAIAPTVFDLAADDGHAFVIVSCVPEHLEAAVRRAVEGCPEQAITVEAESRIPETHGDPVSGAEWNRRR